MADVIERAVGEIFVRDSSSAGVKSATKNFQTLYEVIRFNWWGIQNLGNAFAGVGGMIAGGLGAAVKASVEFDQGLTQIQRTANLSKGEVDDMGKALRNLALTKPISVDALARIAADAGALGIEGVANIKTFTGTIADLISTTNLTEDSAVQLARLAGVLGLQGEDWQRLGSSILYAGVHSAATEKDIVRMSVQLSGAGKTAHMTAAEIVALSATVTSLGASPEKGATAIQRFITQVGKAAATGKPSLQEFARVAGYEGPQAAEKFADAFNKDAAQAIAQFVTGLGKMQTNGLKTTAMLNSLGFSGYRGAGVLQQLAAGTQQTVNPMLNLNRSLSLTQAAWYNNNELQKQAAIVYGSTASQLKIAENVVKDLGIGVGNVLLPALNLVLKPLTDIVWGLDQLPGPAKTFLTYVAAIVAGLLLLVGSALLIAPRMVLIRGSMMELGKVMVGLTDTVGVTVRALNVQAEAEGRLAEVTAFSAARMSRSDKERAVSAYNAMITSKQKQITEQAEANVQGILAARGNLLTEMYIAQSQVKASLAQETRLLAEAQMLEAAGDLEAADGKRVDAEIAAEDAAASQRLATARMQAAEAAAVDAAETRAFAAAEAAAVVEIEAATIAEEGATVATYGLGTAIKAALGPIGLVFAAISAVTIALGFFGGEHRKTADAARTAVAAEAQLTAIIRKTGQTAGQSVNDFYMQNNAFLTAANGAKAFGIEYSTLLSIITGTASIQQSAKFFTDLEAKYKSGNKAAGELHDQVIQLQLQQKASADAARMQAEYEMKTGHSMDDASTAANKEAASLSKLKAAHDAINEAVLDLPGAYLAVRQAQSQVTQAQQALSDAHQAGAQHAEDVAKAQADLTQALLDQRKAQENVASAERALATARADAAQLVIDAQNQLADDTDKLYDTQNKIADLEKKIADERAGPSVHDITEATNKLADANIKLLNSQKKVGDAQYMLNYLMAEGASQRDITDAQDALSAAHQDVADNALAVGDAQDNLNKVRAGADPVQLAKDERDLAAAERDLAEQQRKLKADQLALNQARSDQASGKLYRQRQQELTEAQLALESANWKVTDSTLALHKTQRDNPADKVRDAQLQLESALLALAKANVQVQKDTALMHGEQFGAGREARALADQLDKMGIRAAGPVSAHLKQMSAVLRQSVSDIKDAGAAADNYGAGGLVPTMPKGPDPKVIPEPITGDPKASSEHFWTRWIDDAKHFLHDHAKDIAMALLEAVGLALLLAGTLLGGEVVLFVAGLIAIMATLLIKAAPVIGRAFERAWDDVSNFFTVTIPGWVGRGLLWFQTFGNGIGTRIRSAISNAARTVGNFFTVTIPNGVRGAERWVAGLGSNIGSSIANGISSAARAVSNFATRDVPRFLRGIPGAISGAFSGLGTTLGNLLKIAADAPIDMWNRSMGWIAGRTLTIDFPDWLPGVPDSWGMGFGFFNDLKIPRLAQGGIATQATLAMIGEGAQHEAIIPLDRLAAMFAPVDTLAMEMRANTQALGTLLALQQNPVSGGGDTFNFHEVMADPISIAREVVWAKKVRLR